MLGWELGTERGGGGGESGETATERCPPLSVLGRKRERKRRERDLYPGSGGGATTTPRTAKEQGHCTTRLRRRRVVSGVAAAVKDVVITVVAAELLLLLLFLSAFGREREDEKAPLSCLQTMPCVLHFPSFSLLGNFSPVAAGNASSFSLSLSFLLPLVYWAVKRILCV